MGRHGYHQDPAHLAYPQTPTSQAAWFLDSAWNSHSNLAGAQPFRGGGYIVAHSHHFLGYTQAGPLIRSLGGSNVLLGRLSASPKNLEWFLNLDSVGRIIIRTPHQQSCSTKTTDMSTGAMIEPLGHAFHPAGALDRVTPRPPSFL
jgi:hypothetical protein